MSPNYTKSLNTSVEVLKKYKINEVPIDIHSIIKQTPDMRICGYSKFAEKYECSIEEVIEFLQSELGAISMDPKTNRYVIYYNDTKNNLGLDRFTIAHELGHYFLGHFKLITKAVLNRGGFSSKKYRTMENEANCFARNLLSPVPLYNRIPLESFTSDWLVMDTFVISYEAAITRSKFLKLDSYRITNKDIEYFNSYKMPYYSHCEQCKNPGIEYFNYCPICGEEIIKDNLDFETYKLEGSDYMIYDGIEVDENSKAIVCPVCGNEEPEEGEYCSICGTYLINKCTNEYYPGRSEFDGPLCGALLPGNARYCMYCGAESTFLENKLLKPWKKEKEEKEEIESYNDEVAASTSFDGNDLPF